MRKNKKKSGTKTKKPSRYSYEGRKAETDRLMKIYEAALKKQA